MTAVPQYTAAALIAAGLVLGGSTVAQATTDSPYVTVAWSYPGYPDMAIPQPFISSTPGANLAAFDALAASPEWCGKPIQVDVYQRTDKHGISWESLKSTGALLNGHDGGYLAYNAGIGTPYRVITPKEYPCTTTPTPVPTTEPTGTPTPTPGTPTSLPTPSAPGAPETPAPSDEPTSTPTPTPSPSATAPSTPTPTASSTPSAPATAPTPTDGTTTPATPGSTSVTSGSARHTSPAASSSAAPVAAATSTPDELAYTGTNPWPGLSTAALLLTAGTTLLIARARKAAKR